MIYFERRMRFEHLVILHAAHQSGGDIRGVKVDARQQHVDRLIFAVDIFGADLDDIFFARQERKVGEAQHRVIEIDLRTVDQIAIFIDDGVRQIDETGCLRRLEIEERHNLCLVENRKHFFCFVDCRELIFGFFRFRFSVKRRTAARKRIKFFTFLRNGLFTEIDCGNDAEPKMIDVLLAAERHKIFFKTLFGDRIIYDVADFAIGNDNIDIAREFAFESGVIEEGFDARKFFDQRRHGIDESVERRFINILKRLLFELKARLIGNGGHIDGTVGGEHVDHQRGDGVIFPHRHRCILIKIVANGDGELFIRLIFKICFLLIFLNRRRIYQYDIARRIVRIHFRAHGFVKLLDFAFRLLLFEFGNIIELLLTVGDVDRQQSYRIALAVAPAVLFDHLIEIGGNIIGEAPRLGGFLFARRQQFTILRRIVTEHLAQFFILRHF